MCHVHGTKFSESESFTKHNDAQLFWPEAHVWVNVFTQGEYEDRLLGFRS